ncbi:MAG TPA: ABATE domain-containing protein [Actinomycetota bacterium]|jgi:predicted RNA-binding Zn ribbon-like protein
MNVAEEAGTRPAPGELVLVQAFINTVDLEGGEEQLIDPPALGRWLRDHGLMDDAVPLGEDDLRLAVQVREALRSLARANHDDRTDPRAAALLDRVASGARLRVRFDGGGARLEPDRPGIDGALGRLLGIVYASMVEGTWGRLKACRRETCRWAFYDGSRNHSSSWCDMAVCGNKEKAKAYRRRKAGA